MPKLFKRSGLDKTEFKIKFAENTIDKLINEYAREAGVRNLERHLKRICEKIALKVISK